jgi:alginate O-acetyltransferase complex protein AlgI
MSFTSLTFVVFCVVVLVLYWLVQRKDWQNIILLVASFLFYGWIHPWYAVLLGLSTTADFFLAKSIANSHERTRFYISLSLFLNLGVLAFFKYFNFFNVALASRLSLFGLNGDPLLVSIVLPAGLSFYTLKKLIYILDISHNTLKPVENFVEFALYVSFFPQIISGPIDRPQKLFPQIEAARRWKADFFTSAWPLIVMGFFKKVVVADTIKSIVDRVFSLQAPSKLLVMATALGFTLQILADFSAYTDISRGVARLFGFETSENFRTPYLSLTPSEFWNRWHITLSNFLRDYIFFPLRRSLLRKRTLPSWLVNALPPLVTMFVSGLWHGAGWTYLAWGLYYGMLIVIYQSAGIQGEWKLSSRLKTFGAWLLMFGLIVFGWLLFRAPSLAWVGKVLFQFPLVTTSQDFIIILVVLSMTLAYSLPVMLKLLLDQSLPENSWWHAIFYALITLAIIIYTNSSNPDFIYFQF